MVWIPSWTFQRASFSFQWWWMQSFWRWIPSAPSISSWERFWWVPPISSPVSIPIQPSHIPTTQVETTSMNAWIDYQGNGFTSPGNLRIQASQLISEKFPNHSPEEQQNMIEASVAFHIQEIESNLDHKRGFAKLALPLPEWTNWQDIKIYLVEYDEKNPQNSKIEIFLSWKQIKFLTIADIGLMDFVTKTISRSWEILLLICARKKFSWENNEQASSKFRKAKERFVEEMGEFFQIEWEPLVLGSKKYNPQFDFWAKETARIKFQDKSFNNLF